MGVSALAPSQQHDKEMPVRLSSVPHGFEKNKRKVMRIEMLKHSSAGSLRECIVLKKNPDGKQHYWVPALIIFLGLVTMLSSIMSLKLTLGTGILLLIGGVIMAAIAVRFNKRKSSSGTSIISSIIIATIFAIIVAALLVYAVFLLAAGLALILSALLSRLVSPFWIGAGIVSLGILILLIKLIIGWCR
ncbi:MAG: hypothetical protein NZ529_04695 [Cytophagaceae bacterium]|nr:hypothetical protein [Cytophagaceae bacterium]MDW8456074.1 hypothetical protein [Cytophagaceae bacterium]